MFRTALLILAGAGALGASAGYRDRGDEAKLEQRLAGLTAGRPQNCIEPSRNQGAAHFGNIVLIKDQYGKLYRTSFREGCVARSTDTLISHRISTRLCRGDLIEIRDAFTRIPGATCSYDAFVPYRKPR